MTSEDYMAEHWQVCFDYQRRIFTIRGRIKFGVKVVADSSATKKMDNPTYRRLQSCRRRKPK